MVDSRVKMAILSGLGLTVAGIFAADALNPRWKWVEEMASHYVHARMGWLIPLSLTAFGLSTLAFAAASRRFAPSRAGRALLLVAGVGILVAAAFPADPPGQWDRSSTANLIHGVGGMGALAILPVAAVLISRRTESRLLTVMAGVTVVAGVAFWVTLIDVFDGPSLTFGGYEKVVGLTERIALWTVIGWLAAATVAPPTRKAEAA